jgi:hypothetical protein
MHRPLTLALDLTPTLPSCLDLDIGEVGEELQSAAAMLRSDPAAGPAAALLAKVLRNILASPIEPKFRRGLPPRTLMYGFACHTAFRCSLPAALSLAMCQNSYL